MVVTAHVPRPTEPRTRGRELRVGRRPRLPRLAVRAAALALALVACGDDGAPAGPGGSAGSIGCSPTNVVSVEAASEPLVLSGTCTVDTDAGTISCASGFGFSLATQSYGSTPVAIFRSGDLTVSPGANVSIVGSNPGAFVSFGTIRVEGTVYAGPNPVDQSSVAETSTAFPRQRSIGPS